MGQNKQKNRERNGFTLIEMVVSLAMIVMVTTLFIANYQTTNKRSDLIMTAQKLVSDIHQAQNQALGLFKYGSSVPAGGWGVHFNKAEGNQYLIFADLDAPGELGNLDYNVDEGDISSGARLVELPPLITISSIKVGGLEKNSVNITFLPPDPQTNIYDGVATSTEVLIELKEERNNTVKTIEANFLGLVEVID